MQNITTFNIDLITFQLFLIVSFIILLRFLKHVIVRRVLLGWLLNKERINALSFNFSNIEFFLFKSYNTWLFWRLFEISLNDLWVLLINFWNFFVYLLNNSIRQHQRRVFYLLIDLNIVSLWYLYHLDCLIYVLAILFNNDLHHFLRSLRLFNSITAWLLLIT